MSDNLVPGAVITVAHPFVYEDAELIGDEGPYTAKTWRPGVRFVANGYHQYGHLQYERGDAVADGVGCQSLTIVSVHKPGRFPTRVFYTRQWQAPNGKSFGNGKLHSKVLGSFRRMIAGYRHEYRLTEPADLTGARDD